LNVTTTVETGRKGPSTGVGAALRSDVAVLGVLAALAYICAVIVGGHSYPGYSHLYNSVSELTGSDAPRLPLVQALFALYNASLMACGVRLYTSFRFVGASTTEGARHGRAASALLVVIAALGFSMYFCPQDPRAADLTLPGTLHLILAGVTAVLTMVAMGLVAREAGRNPRLRKLRWHSGLSLAVTFISGGVGAAALTQKAALGGLCERFTIGCFIQWFVVLAVALGAAALQPERQGRQ
jgi:hypothetical membrane protein